MLRNNRYNIRIFVYEYITINKIIIYLGNKTTLNNYFYLRFMYKKNEKYV
jgi:hypothetical protein